MFLISQNSLTTVIWCDNFDDMTKIMISSEKKPMYVHLDCIHPTI